MQEWNWQHAGSVKLLGATAKNQSGQVSGERRVGESTEDIMLGSSRVGESTEDIMLGSVLGSRGRRDRTGAGWEWTADGMRATERLYGRWRPAGARREEEQIQTPDYI